MKDLLVILILLFVLGVCLTGGIGMLGMTNGQCAWVTEGNQSFCGNWGTDQVFGK